MWAQEGFHQKEIDELKKLLDKLVKSGLARPSTSKWAAPVVLVKEEGWNQ